MCTELGEGSVLRTGVVDEDVDAPDAGLDGLESFLNGQVAGDVDLDGLNGVEAIGALLYGAPLVARPEGIGALLSKRRDGLLASFQRTAAEKNVVGLVGLQ